MKKLFLLFLILLAAIGIGFLIHQNPGYAMVSYGHWMIATSVWVAFASILVLFFVFYFIVRVIKNIFAIPTLLARRRAFLNAKHYEKYISQGILDLYAGNFRQAEKFFLKLPEKYNSSSNYLLAAQAAHEQHAYERRDQYLQKALMCGADSHFSVALAKAQFCFQEKKYDDALLAYKELFKEDPKNPVILNALKEIYLNSRQVGALKLILPQLKRQRLISNDEIKLIESQVSV